MHTITDEQTEVIDRRTGLTKSWRLVIQYNQDFDGMAHVRYEADDLPGVIECELPALSLATGLVNFFGTFLPVKAQFRLVAIMATRRLRYLTEQAIDSVLDEQAGCPDRLMRSGGRDVALRVKSLHHADATLRVRTAIEAAIPRRRGTPP